MKYFILICLVALTIAFYRIFLKLITVDKFFALAIQGLFMFVVGLVLYFVFGNNSLNEVVTRLDSKNLFFIFMAGFVLILNGFLIMTGLRMWFDISKFTVAYAILWNVIVVLVGYFYFKDSINLWNWVGILLALVSIYLLSIK